MVRCAVQESGEQLAAAEKIFSELTAKLADLTAQRNQLSNALRQHSDRAARARSIDEEGRGLGEQRILREASGDPIAPDRR